MKKLTLVLGLLVLSIPFAYADHEGTGESHITISGTAGSTERDGAIGAGIAFSDQILLPENFAYFNFLFGFDNSTTFRAGLEALPMHIKDVQVGPNGRLKLNFVPVEAHGEAIWFRDGNGKSHIVFNPEFVLKYLHATGNGIGLELAMKGGFAGGPIHDFNGDAVLAGPSFGLGAAVLIQVNCDDIIKIGAEYKTIASINSHAASSESISGEAAYIASLQGGQKLSLGLEGRSEKFSVIRFDDYGDGRLSAPVKYLGATIKLVF